MRNKKLFSFDEVRDAEILYNHGFPNGNIDYSQMYLVAKYIRETFNYGEIRLEKALIDFCQKYDKTFNPVIEEEAIKKWVKSAMEYNLRKIENVSVTKKEIDFIKQIKNEREKKALFAMLVLAKALKKGGIKRHKPDSKPSNKYYIRYSNFIDIIRLTKLNNMREIDLANIIFKHKEHFTFYKPEKELIRINFIDKNQTNDIVISKLDNLMDYFHNLFSDNKTIKNYGEHKSKCISCGKEILKNSNRQKKCKECAMNERREKQKLLMRKRRSL